MLKPPIFPMLKSRKSPIFPCLPRPAMDKSQPMVEWSFAKQGFPMTTKGYRIPEVPGWLTYDFPIPCAPSMVLFYLQNWVIFMANLAKYTSTMVRRWLWFPPDLAKQTSLCPNLPMASPKADALSRRHYRGGIGRGPKRPAAAKRLLAFWRFCAAAAGGGGDGVSGRLVEKNRGEMEKWWRNMGRKWEFDVCFFWILISMVEPGRKRAFLLMGIWWGYYMEFHGGTHQAKKWQDEIRTSLICIFMIYNGKYNQQYVFWCKWCLKKSLDHVLGSVGLNDGIPGKWGQNVINW